MMVKEAKDLGRDFSLMKTLLAKQMELVDKKKFDSRERGDEGEKAKKSIAGSSQYRHQRIVS